MSMCITSGVELCVTSGVTVIGNSGGELYALDVEGSANSGGFVGLEVVNSGSELSTSTELLGVVMTTTGLLSLVLVCEVKVVWLVVDAVSLSVSAESPAVISRSLVS